MTESTLKIIHVGSNAELQDASHDWQGETAVAIDTEFVRVDTYFPIAGLIQVGCRGHCYLIDPLSIDDLSPLKALLEDPAVLKILHACSEDLELFRSLVDTIPAPLFDTQIAAALIGQGFSRSYQALVELVLGISIAKGETRSNWLQRPLSESQCQYAALDVEHLAEIHAVQVALLQKAGRSDWMSEECERLLAAANDYVVPEDYYMKISSAWRLDRPKLMILKTLCAWREREAREHNKPRNHVIKEKALVLIAREQPGSKEELKTTAEMSPRQIRKYGDKVLLLAAEAGQVPENQCPPLMDKPLGKETNSLLKQLRNRVIEVAEQLQMAPEMLAKKRHLEELIRLARDSGEFVLPGSLDGWRREVVGEQLMTLVRNAA
jgi:ribonuclease D